MARSKKLLGRTPVSSEKARAGEPRHHSRSARPLDAYTHGGDPALAMFEFFPSRHLQAAARRQADLPGPKRTAKAYDMLQYLEKSVDLEALCAPPPETR